MLTSVGSLLLLALRLAPQTSPIKNIIFQSYTPLIYSSVCLATLPLTLSLVSSFCAWSQTFVLSFLPILLTVDTVASDYALPAIGARSGLSPIKLYPCRANHEEARRNT